MRTKSLYIHIPFCKKICSYCDFVRVLNNDKTIVKNYIILLIKEIKKQCKFHKFKTIYIGGGTPNSLDEELLENLLKILYKYCNQNCEFSIECNPELVTENQVKLFKKYKVNRISLGVQSLSENILKTMRRDHSLFDVENALNLFYKYEIDNISLDFIYNYPNQTLYDLKLTVDFIKKHNIKHVSYYALELKDNSLLTKMGYKINLDNEEIHLQYLEHILKKNGYKRYEISNWSISEDYQSQHNLNYWKYNDWKAIGYGAIGLEKRNNYSYKTINNLQKNKNIISKKEYEVNKLLMNLRLLSGFNIKKNYKIFHKYKSKLKDYYIHDDILRPKNINCLNDTIIGLIEEKD